LGGDKTAYFLQGSSLQGWFAPNITGDVTHGVGQWSSDDLVGYLKTGHNRVSAATGPMADVVTLSSSQMTTPDLRAIAAYLKSLEGRSSSTTPLRNDHPLMKAGSAIYRDQCSACHGLDGHGTPLLFPSLAESSLVRADNPGTLIRILLRGARSVSTASEPTAPGMPAYGWQLDDAQVAAVLTYIRNSWGGAAVAVSADEVGNARTQLGFRAD